MPEVSRADDTAQPEVGSDLAASDPTVARIRELIARSSLGTPGAVELRDRTSPELATLVRQLGDLRNRLAHSPSRKDLTAQEVSDLMWIAEESERLGLNDTTRWALNEVAATALHRLARSYAQNGQPDLAKTWLARAQSLSQE